MAGCCADLQIVRHDADFLSRYRKGFFNFAQATLPLLLESVDSSPHPPSLIITGATASLRGSATMSAFASGKFALRATAQSLAREFGPKGVHVAHVIVDGVIDIPRTKEWPVNGGAPDGKINSGAVSTPFLGTYVVDERSADLDGNRLRMLIGIFTRNPDRTSLRRWIVDHMWRSFKCDVSMNI